MNAFKKSLLIFIVGYYCFSLLFCLTMSKTVKDVIFVIIAYIFAYGSSEALMTGEHWRHSGKFVLFNNLSLHKKIYFVICFGIILVSSYLMFVKRIQAWGPVIGLGCSFDYLFLKEKFSSKC